MVYGTSIICLQWGPIIGLWLHGLDPIFTCDLRIWQRFFYGLRLQHETRLASFCVKSQRFTVFKMRMRLLAKINQETDSRLKSYCIVLWSRTKSKKVMFMLIDIISLQWHIRY